MIFFLFQHTPLPYNYVCVLHNCSKLLSGYSLKSKSYELACFLHYECIMADTLKEKIALIEKQAIIKALQESNWVKAGAARSIGITKRMIGYKIKKYGIKKEVDE